MKRLILLLFIIVSFVNELGASVTENLDMSMPVASVNNQGWRVSHYDNRNGLSHNSVKCIFEDSKGFMWFGTKNGLNRFDGKEFRTYIYDGKPGSLRSSIIYDMIEDDEQRIWVATADGVYIFYPKEDKFIRFEEIVKSHISISNIIWHLRIDSSGCIWILSQNGIYTYSDNIVTDLTEKIRKYMDTLPETIFIEGSTAYFGNMDGKVICCDRYCNRVLNVASVPSAIWTIGEYGNDKLLLGTQQRGVYVVDVIADSTYQMPVEETVSLNNDGLFVHSVCKINDKEYWVGSEAGLLTITNDEMHAFPQELIQSGAFEDDVPRAIFRDRHGNVWTGNYFGGIDCFTPNDSPFRCMIPSEQNAACGRRVDCFAEDKNGRIWIGTEDNGLCYYEPSTGMFAAATTKQGTPLITSSIQCLTLISDDELLIGSTTEGVYKLNIDSGQLTHIVKDADVYSLLLDSQGNVWAGIHSEVCLFNKETKRFEVFQPEIHSFAHSIMEDAHGNIWAIAMNQICRISLKDRSMQRFNFDDERHSTQYYGCAVAGLCDSKGRVWLGFEEGGLCLFNEETETLTKITEINGSLGNGVYSIVEDQSGLLWVGTNNGLGAYDHESHSLVGSYDMGDGLPTKQISYRSGLVLRSGELVFGTAEGLFTFNPSEISQDKSLDCITITDLFIGAESINSAIAYNDAVTLLHDQSTFTISFSTLNYSSKGNSCVAYQLKGFDKGWNVQKDLNRVSYHNVPPGNYTFCVRSISSPIEKNAIDRGGPVATLKINIRPTWYQTITAKLAFVTVIAAIVLMTLWVYYKNRKRKLAAIQIEREKANEQRLYQAKIDFFTHIAHEIRTPASLIKDPIHRLRKRNLPTEVESTLALVERNAEELNTLISELLDFRKLETTDITINVKPVDIKELIHDIWSRYVMYATDNGLRTSLTLPDGPLMAHIDANATTKILNNLFSNAIKYATTYIRIILTSDRDQELVVFSICNDGLRIPNDMQYKIFEPFVQVPNSTMATQGSGIGLALASTLCQMQNGKLLLNTQAVDNEFDLLLPLSLPVEQAQLQDSDAPVKNSEETPCVTAPNNNSTRSSILVVEDSNDMRSYLASILRDEYEVFEASDGIYALEVLKKTDVDLILTDVMMPRKDGLELCKDVKSSMDLCHIPVVMLTAKDLLDDHILGLEQGADAYIPKPFSTDFLEAQIRNLIENRRRLQNKFAHSADSTTSLPASNETDRKFLEKVTNEVIAHLEDDGYNIENLASSMAMSSSTLSRKIKAITGQTPGDFMVLIRLKKAAELLRTGGYRVGEVCMMVGFNSAHHFSEIFKKQFGLTPGMYARTHRTDSGSDGK